MLILPSQKDQKQHGAKHMHYFICIDMYGKAPPSHIWHSLEGCVAADRISAFVFQNRDSSILRDLKASRELLQAQKDHVEVRAVSLVKKSI